MGVKTRKLGNIDTQLVQWQSSIFIGDGSTGLTAEVGKGYFIDTTSGAVTVTLPAHATSQTGDQIAIKDYARTFGTNNVTLASNLFDGTQSSSTLSTSGQSLVLVFSDGNKGWQLINDDSTTKLGPSYIEATGGTVTTSGDFKIHSFTGDGNFSVSSLGNPAGGGDKVSYVVVAGGGAGSGNPNANSGGGGGAGGFREGKCTGDPYSDSPLDAGAGLTVEATCYPITVGAGGTGAQNSIGTSGSNSIFSTITSAGGGRGGGPIPGGPDSGLGGSGGSGGGAGAGSPPGSTGGSGNTPPVSPPQGNNGGSVPPGQSPDHQSAGGGGAGAAGQNSSAPKGGDGGVGVSTSITGSAVSYAGGGGGTGFQGPRVGGASPCGTGGGGTHGSPFTGNAGTANRGGGGGSAEGYTSSPNNATGGAGGKGIVIIRYKVQN